jgi:PPOX class probable F420-dependent enzyme
MAIAIQGDKDENNPMNDEKRQNFLAKTRYGYLTTLRREGSPLTVPVWFEWDGEVVRIFTGKSSAKVRHIQNDPRVTVLVANHLDEPEAWVAFDGTAAIEPEGGFELAERLAHKYWDLSDPERKAVLESWRAGADTLCVIALRPERIRTYAE